MWQIINVEPADGECSICRSHECGVVDGKHQWIMSDALDDLGEPMTVYIGYKCIKLFADNLGVTKEVVEKVVHVPISDEQILHAIKSELELKFDGYTSIVTVPHDSGVRPSEQKATVHARSKAKATK